MPLSDRAAQFSPFAALTGHDAAIEETVRITDPKLELSDTAIERLNSKLSFISEHLSDGCEVTVTHFQTDRRKDGGSYLSYTGTVKWVDDYEQCLVMQDGTEIYFENIRDIICNDPFTEEY